MPPPRARLLARRQELGGVKQLVPSVVSQEPLGPAGGRTGRAIVGVSGSGEYVSLCWPANRAYAVFYRTLAGTWSQVDSGLGVDIAWHSHRCGARNHTVHACAHAAWQHLRRRLHSNALARARTRTAPRTVITRHGCRRLQIQPPQERVCRAGGAAAAGAGAVQGAQEEGRPSRGGGRGGGGRSQPCGRHRRAHPLTRRPGRHDSLPAGDTAGWREHTGEGMHGTAACCAGALVHAALSHASVCVCCAAAVSRACRSRCPATCLLRCTAGRCWASRSSA